MADSKNKPAERRESPRVAMTFLLLDLADKGGTWVEREGDLSLGGIYWRGATAPHGVAVDVRFRLPGEPKEVRARGEILRVMGRGKSIDFHVRFTDLDVQSELAIARFLDDEVSKGE